MVGKRIRKIYNDKTTFQKLETITPSLDLAFAGYKEIQI